VVFVLASLAIACLSGCGGAGDSPRDVVAHVGGTAITKASLNHWMATIIGGDFYEISHLAAPRGLVSEPPNYAVCVVGLKAFLPNVRHGTAETQLKSKCEQLHEALKQQALAYLITAQVAVGQDTEQGLKVSAGEVEQEFKRVQETQFPNEGELQRYIAERHWSLADELFLIKRDLLSRKLRLKLTQRFSIPDHEAALIKYVGDINKLWTAKTTCDPGYVVQGCKEYTSAQINAASTEPSPAILIEELARLHG
jgi:hypothetical protein